MPELPEVQTTASGIDRALRGIAIKDVWTDWPRTFRGGFESVRDAVRGKKILGASRRGKNVLISLSGNTTVIVHMKMTGHLLYGKYENKSGVWKPRDPESPLADPYNRFVHAVFILSNGKHLVFSDTRKFGRIAAAESGTLENSPLLSHLGPEPLGKGFTLGRFKERLAKRPRGKIKQVLMNQEVVAGIGNIYSDEMLWRAGIHPETPTGAIGESALAKLFKGMREVLRQGIKLRGDSMSDYRNIDGRRGAFQKRHQAYRKTGERCARKSCRGVILRKLVGGRSAHYCSVHQAR